MCLWNEEGTVQPVQEGGVWAGSLPWSLPNKMFGTDVVGPTGPNAPPAIPTYTLCSTTTVPLQ